MNENLYAEYPEAYDALYAWKDYDAEVEFVLSQFEEMAETDGRRALVVGCGTGEHSKRLREEGFEVVGVDKYEAMVERARTKSDAEFRVGALPDLPVEGQFDLAWLPFTVVQHLDPDEVAESLRAVANRLADGGLLVFDQITGEDFSDSAYLRTYESKEGAYARLTHVHQVENSEYSVVESESRYDAVVFTPDGEFFVDAHHLFGHDPAYLSGVCDVLGLSVETLGWYDEEAAPGEDGHYVFVAS